MYIVVKPLENKMNKARGASRNVVTRLLAFSIHREHLGGVIVSMKFEVTHVMGKHLGIVKTPKAKKAILFGIARGHRDVNERVLVTEHICMEHFNKEYLECMKKSKNNKVECWECGKTTTSPESKIPYCTDCKLLINEQRTEDQIEFTRLRTKSMLERALEILQKQNKPIKVADYKEAANAIAEYTEMNSGKFDSAYEILAAMELIRNKVHIKIQQTVANKNVDFILEEEQVILEIDGYLHEYSKEEDYRTDLDIRTELGSNWEVVRIPTKYIETNISMLYEAIMESKIYKQELRKQNHGILPDFYSERDKQVWNKLV